MWFKKKSELNPDEQILHDAVQNGNLEKVNELLKKGVNPNSGLAGEGSNLMRAIDEKYFDIARVLIDYGANVNYSDDLGDTPLGIAVFVSSIEMVKQLVSKGSKIDFKDRSGHTPLYYAKRDNKTELVEFLQVNASKPEIG